MRLNDYATLTIQTSRGCPFDCEFCDVVNLFGRLPRHKTPKQVIAELETLHRLGVKGSVFICDDNFIGSKKHARALLQELIPWLRSRGEPFRFLTQASVNLGQDLEMIDLMTAANFDKVFIGIESPDDNVLQISHKYHNIKNPLVASLRNIQQHGLAVIGSFIIGLDGEKPGAGERIGAFMEQTAIPTAMLGVLQAAPHTRLWHRLEKEGRLRQDMGDDLGTFSALNYEPDRPEADIMREYVEAWDYLYEPSRYLSRAYRYYLAMRPVRHAPAVAALGPLPKDRVPDQGITWRRILILIKAFFKIIWWQGVRTAYRRQFWTQMIGMLRHNPTRFMGYIVTCAMGGDLFNMRRVVREKATAIIKERDRVDLDQATLMKLPPNRACMWCKYGKMYVSSQLEIPDPHAFTRDFSRKLFPRVLLGDSWTAGCACPGPRRPAPPPVVVAPPPPPQPEAPVCPPHARCRSLRRS